MNTTCKGSTKITALYVTILLTAALVDVNECQEDIASCDDNAFCVNTVGGYTCDNCKPGYLDVSGDGKICQGKLIYNIIIILLPTWDSKKYRS